MGVKLKTHNMALIFWLGVGLLIAAALVFAACGFSCFYHIGDDTGTSGGFDGIEVYCTPIAALTYILAGVFCMVGIHTWNLVVSIICNIVSVSIHLLQMHGLWFSQRRCK